MAKKPRVVIIGAGMAGLTAANKIYLASTSKDLFELCIVEAGTRIGGRINTTEFGGDRIEMGATWIHGIGGSPIYKISQEINSLVSQQPWECMDGLSSRPMTVAEGGFEINPSIVEPVSSLFDSLMDYAQGKLSEDSTIISGEKVNFYNLANKAFEVCTSSNGDSGKLSVGYFLKQGLNSYWDCLKTHGELEGQGTWSRKLLEEDIFAMNENTLRTFTSAGDLSTLDFKAESEYQMFPDEEITIAKGYISVIEHLASLIPPGLIQLGRKVTNIEWQPEEGDEQSKQMENGINGASGRPVKLRFCDGSTMLADHVIVTVSLGVLKAGINRDSGMFNPPLPSFKTDAISRLGYGVVNKLFMQVSQSRDLKGDNLSEFPFLHMAFHPPDSEFRNKKIPWWMRRIASLCPIYEKSSVLLSWFAGEEALELESLSDEEIVNGVSTTISSFLSQPQQKVESNCNGNVNLVESSRESEFKVTKVLKSKWGTDPLFLGSYSYVAVGSSGDDLDTMAEPLPSIDNSQIPPLQILFAGEATHRTHYSTTHGAYFSGLREAKRLLQHYRCLGDYDIY